MLAQIASCQPLLTTRHTGRKPAAMLLQRALTQATPGAAIMFGNNISLLHTHHLLTRPRHKQTHTHTHKGDGTSCATTQAHKVRARLSGGSPHAIHTNTRPHKACWAPSQSLLGTHARPPALHNKPQASARVMQLAASMKHSTSVLLISSSPYSCTTAKHWVCLHPDACSEHRLSTGQGQKAHTLPNLARTCACVASNTWLVTQCSLDKSLGGTLFQAFAGLPRCTCY